MASSWFGSRRILLPVVGLLLVAAALVGWFWSHSPATPPDFVPGAHKYRITVPDGTDGRNVTYPPNIDVDGTPVLVQTEGVDIRHHRTMARMYVRVGAVPAEGQPPLPETTGYYGKGDRIRLAGIQVRILQIWNEPISGDDAVDVLVTGSHAAPTASPGRTRSGG